MSTTTTLVRLTPADLEEAVRWFHQVGLADWCSVCPVASALARAIGRKVYVNGMSWRYQDEEPDRYRPLPDHVVHFVHQVDACYGDPALLRAVPLPAPFEVQA